GVRKQVALENLRRAFPDCDFARRYRVANGCYRFYARAAVEWLKTDDVLEKYRIKTNGVERLEKYTESGAVVAAGHIGYWELTGVLLARSFGEIYVYADQQSNPYSQGLIDRMRQKYNIFTYSSASGVRRLVKVLKSGGLVGVVGDQRPRGKSLYIPFFNRYVQNTRIPALLTRSTGAPVLPVFSVRTAPEEITMFVEPPLETSLKPREKQDGVELLREYNSVLERYIREYPRQYFWLHRRWKGARGPSSVGDNDG
ncbi:MAG: lysophospholipid acyltransferase family protein, partial [bacterium]